jgi:ABC-2 type transport system ATP-binding protein
MEKMIETKNLTKKFGKIKAVDGIALSVQKGEIYGFLGLNGAGKTTTIRMMLGMIRPTSGECYLDGKKVNPGNHDLWNRVGYLVEVPYSYPDLTVKENLEIIRRLRLFPDDKAVDAVMEKFNISQYRDRLVKNLSLGNAQRLGLAKAILHDPTILILDEPANSLDPAGIVEIRELLHDLAQNQGVTIFLSSHILGEVAKFATRIGIIHQGKLLQELDTDQLEHFRKKSLFICTKDNNSACAILLKQGISAKMTDTELIEITDNESISNPAKVNTMLVHSGYAPSMLKVEEEDLESYFLRVIGRNGDAQ